MFLSRRRSCLLLALALARVSPAQAPPQRYATPDWIIDRWSSDQGLPQNTINDIVQTSDGFVWLATYGGLVRFDGVRFTAFTTREYPELGSDRVILLKLSPDGTMWIGTDRGLARFKDGKFREWTESDGRPAGVSMGVFPNADGSVWIATTIGGLALLRNGRFERFTDRGVPAGYVEGVWADRDGAVWVNLGVGRFLIREPGETSFRPIDVTASGRKVQQFSMVDHAGATWFETNRGSGRWNGSVVEREVEGHLIRDDYTKGFWTAGSDALIHTDSARRVDRIPLPIEPGLNQLKALFVDREGTPWIGTNTLGLLRLRRRVFHMYFKADGLENEQIAAVFRDRQGRLLVGTNCSSTFTLAGSRFERTTLPGCAFAMDQMPDGALLFGGYGGASRVARDGRVTWWPGDSLGSNDELVTFADKDSSIWVGTANGLLHVVRAQRTRYSTADGLPSNEIHWVSRDRQGALWVGTIGGLARLDGTRFQAWTTRDGLPHNAVRAVYQDADGIWWIGTYGGGLGRFDGKRFVTISTREGLYDDIVSSIHEDVYGNLWMSGNRGIFRASRRALNAFAAGESQSVASPGYGPSDGLLTVETNGGFEPSSWQDADGRLWFATVRGLATIDPKHAMVSAAPPSVAIEAMRVDGRTVPLDSASTLPVGTRSLEFDYTGLTSVNPQQVVFRYRIENVDRDWQYVNVRRTAYYSQLAPGHYTFVVTAANPDGVWNPAEQRLSFAVPAPWYATFWFRALVLLTAVGTVAFIVRQRIERLHERARLQREFAQQLLAAQEAERSRIAGELHDSLSQDLLVMRNRAAIALRTVSPDDAVRPHIEEIVEVASQASRNAREISHNLRPHQLDHLGLAAAVRDLAVRVSAASGLEILVEGSDVDRLLSPEQATHVYRIVQEGLNNVLKHANARHVSIRMRPADGGVTVSLADDGRGFDSAQRNGFGLNGIGQRVQLMGGWVDVRSAPGKGTTIEILVRPA